MEEELYDWWFNEHKDLPFEIIDHGGINTTDGPDIQNVIIEYNGVRQSGSVELDYKSSYWLLHGHFQNHRFQDVLLHLTMHSDLDIKNGFIPKYSFSIDTYQFIENIKSTDFWLRKISLIKAYEPFYTREEIFEILFARSLGFFHNRDVMTYIASIKIKTNELTEKNSFHFLKSKVEEFKRSTRPNNRLDTRLEQYLHLTNNEDYLKEVRMIIRNRYTLNKIIKNVYKLSEITGTNLGKDRIIQWLFNGIIPFELYFSKTSEVSYKQYLNQLILELKQFKAISSFHE